jgi:hypothetical protein
MAGRCAQNGPPAGGGRTVYVNNANGSCSDNGPGTDVGNPFCTLGAAYASAMTSELPYVRALGGGPDYQVTVPMISSGQIVFIGAPSHNVTASAIVDARNMAAFSVVNTASLTVDGFTLNQLNPNATTISCDGTGPASQPTLILRNSTLSGVTHNNDLQGNAAVDLSNCQATVSGNYIGVTTMLQPGDTTTLANSVGVHVTSNYMTTSYLIENNVIAGNQDVGVNLYDLVYPTVTFQFNTVYNNGRRLASGKLAGGITCPGTSMVAIGYSIIAGNNTDSAGTQINNSSSGCTFTQDVVGSMDMAATGVPALIPLDPVLSNSYALTTDPKDQSCCVDKAQPGTGQMFPPTDLIGTSRPQGAAWDLGAFELPVTTAPMCM